MNPLAALLPALYTALTSPALVWAGADVPVYQPQAPGALAGHYVLLTQPTDQDAGGAAGCRQYSCTVALDVVSQFAPGAVSSLPAEHLVSDIHARLRGQRLALGSGWDCQPGRLENEVQLPELDGTTVALRRVLLYRWELFYHL